MLFLSRLIDHPIAKFHPFYCDERNINTTSEYISSSSLLSPTGWLTFSVGILSFFLAAADSLALSAFLLFWDACFAEGFFIRPLLFTGGSIASSLLEEMAEEEEDITWKEWRLSSERLLWEGGRIVVEVAWADGWVLSPLLSPSPSASACNSASHSAIYPATR